MPPQIPTNLGTHADFPQSQVKFDSSLGFFRTFPYPDESQLADFYTEEYREIRQEKPDENYVAFMRHRAFAQRDFILQHAPGRRFRRVMDIGCGVGRFVQPMVQAGLSVWAVDPDLASLHRCVWHAAGGAGALDVHWSRVHTLPEVTVTR